MERLNVAVEEYTSPALVTASSSQSLQEVMGVMESNGVRHVLILDETSQNVVGLISQRDLRVALMVDVETKLLAKDIMIRDLFTTPAGAPLDEVVFEMSSRKIGSAVVENENNEVYGIFTTTDALNALIEVVRGVSPES